MFDQHFVKYKGLFLATSICLLQRKYFCTLEDWGGVHFQIYYETSLLFTYYHYFFTCRFVIRFGYFYVRKCNFFSRLKKKKIAMHFHVFWSFTSFLCNTTFILYKNNKWPFLTSKGVPFTLLNFSNASKKKKNSKPNKMLSVNDATLSKEKDSSSFNLWL